MVLLARGGGFDGGSGVLLLHFFVCAGWTKSQKAFL